MKLNLVAYKTAETVKRSDQISNESALWITKYIHYHEYTLVLSP